MRRRAACGERGEAESRERPLGSVRVGVGVAVGVAGRCGRCGFGPGRAGVREGSGGTALCLEARPGAGAAAGRWAWAKVPRAAVTALSCRSRRGVGTRMSASGLSAGVGVRSLELRGMVLMCPFHILCSMEFRVCLFQRPGLQIDFVIVLEFILRPRTIFCRVGTVCFTSVSALTELSVLITPCSYEQHTVRLCLSLFPPCLCAV